MVGSSNLRDDLDIQALLDNDPVLVQKLNMAQNFLETTITRDPRSTRGRTPRNAKNIFEFFDLVREALNDKFDREQGDPEQRPKFVEEFPPQDLTTEIITWSVVHRQPGQMSAGPPSREPSRREMRPTFRDSVPSEDPGYKDIIVGQVFDNIVAFTCWAKTNKVANYRALWFEEFMTEYYWFFQYSGIPRVVFLERLEDSLDEQANNKLVKRELRYLVRTERLYTISQKTITELVVKLHVNEASKKLS